MVHQSKMEALREALKAADEQLSQQKSLNTQLELEVRKQIEVPSLKRRKSSALKTFNHFLRNILCRTNDWTPSLELCCIAWTSLKKRLWTFGNNVIRSTKMHRSSGRRRYRLLLSFVHYYFYFSIDFCVFFGLFENAFPFLFLCNYSNILNFGRFAFDAGVEKQTGGHWSLRE